MKEFFFNRRKNNRPETGKIELDTKQYEELEAACRRLQQQSWDLLNKPNTIIKAKRGDYTASRFEDFYNDFPEFRGYYRQAKGQFHEGNTTGILSIACPGKGLAAPVLIDNLPQNEKQYLRLQNKNNSIMKTTIRTTFVYQTVMFYTTQDHVRIPTLEEISQYSNLLDSVEWIK